MPDRASLTPSAPQSIRDVLAPPPSSRLREKWDELMAWEDDMLAFCNRVAMQADLYRAALEEIAAQQPKTVETLRRNGIVFDDLKEHWQKVGFTIYTDLCQVDVIARQALVEDEDDDE